MSFPVDVSDKEWNQDNLQRWRDPIVVNSENVHLLPLEAKALHVIGTLVQILDSAGHLLYSSPDKRRPWANYCQYAYLLACSAIELLARCHNGVTNPRKPTLKSGLRIVGLKEVDVNVKKDGEWTIYTYDTTTLVALRNLIAHGQGVASAGDPVERIVLHVELLDSFPDKLSRALDDYYESIFESPDPRLRKQLAISRVEPTLYSVQSGQAYRSPVWDAYSRIYQAGKKPSEVLKYTDWQIYNPARDSSLDQ